MEYIGYIMIAAPFIALFVAMVIKDGMQYAIEVTSITFLVSMCVFGGVYLVGISR
jgi:hypothetical protein